MVKYSKYIITILILQFPLHFVSQNINRDSLWIIFNNKSQADTNRLKALQKIAWSYSNNNPDTAIILSQNVLKIAKQCKQKKYEAISFNTLGVSFYNKGNYPKAIDYYLMALKIRLDLGDKKNTAGCYINIANVYSNQSNYTKALDYYLNALKILEEIDDKQFLGNCYNNIGLVYQNLNIYPKALEYYFKSLKILEGINDKIFIGNCYNNIGIIYENQSNYIKALEYYSKDLKISEENNDKIGMAYNYTNIGHVYLNESNYPKALDFFLKGLRLKNEVNDKEGLGTSYINIGIVYYDLHNYKLALAYCDSALQNSKEIKDIDIERLAYENFANAYQTMGNYELAYENYVRFKTLTDSIFNMDNSKQLGDLKTNYEVEKKETELKVKAEAQQLINNEEKKRQKFVIYSVAGILLIVIIFSALLYKRFRLTNKQKKIIEAKEQETQQQKYLIEEKHKEIKDSINYAERIQRSFLASTKTLDENLKNYFVLFKPKDVVSGDFYWADNLANGNFILATSDSTGHGVPGAIMSLLNITSLEKAVEYFTNPADILNHTRQTIINRLKRDGSTDGGKDGMDCSLLVFDFANKQLQISAANNPVWIIRSNELIEIKPDKMPVGKSDRDSESFTLHIIELLAGDTIYTLTDGFPDQFGGPNGKKFMSKKLKELLVENVNLPILKQKELLEITFKNWVGDLEQVDDVCIVGIRI